ncbi:MAG: EthD domain-containing protein [Novosphingobium sp.]
MITLIVAARKKAGMSRKEFEDHWLNRHAPLVLSVPEFASYLRKYALYPYAEGADVPGLGALPGYDGIGELWFDSVEAMMEAFSEPKYLEIIRPDEELFLDRDACLTFVTEERIFKAGDSPEGARPMAGTT